MTECWSHLTLSPRVHSILPALGLAVMCLGHPAAWAQDTPDAIAVPDPSLRSVLEDSLGLSAGDPIPAATLAGLPVLEAPDAGIVDLTGLEHATGLTRLDLGPGSMRDPRANSNEVSDLSPLAALIDLTWLDLSGNSVEDVTPLAGLTGLTLVNLQVNMVSDVASLSGLTSLTDLYLAFNPLRDASSLSHLTGLTVHETLSQDYGRFPANLDNNLIRVILFYEEALAKGMVRKDLASSGPCQHLPGSVSVTVVTDTPENADTVGQFLEPHGVAVWWPSREAAREGIGQGLGCVPVPLLVALSELPGVTRVEKEIGSRPPPRIPTAAKEVPWGSSNGQQDLVIDLSPLPTVELVLYAAPPPWRFPGRFGSWCLLQSSPVALNAARSASASTLLLSP